MWLYLSIRFNFWIEDEKVNQADNSQVHPQNIFLNEDNTVKKRSSFVDTKKTKIQLTWKNVIIKAKPKKRLCCNKNQEESFTILGKIIRNLDEISKY